MSRLSEARREIERKSDAAIDRDTAKTWAARAIAAYEKYARSGDPRCLERATNFRHEAVEHAGSTGDDRFAASIRRTIDRVRRRRRKRYIARKKHRTAARRR